MKPLPSDLVLPPHTIAGRGAARSLLVHAATFGGPGVLIHGGSLERSGVLRRILDTAPAGLRVTALVFPGGEPTPEQVDALRARAHAVGAQWVAGVGGGSVLDAAKACAGLLHAPLPAAAYHQGAPLEPGRTPFLAVPATAGTGSEAAGVCVLTDPARGIKRSFRHPSYIARLVILDPDLIASCPASVVAHAGMDALTQAVESYTSRNATAFTDALAGEAVRLVAGSIEAVFANPAAPEAEPLLAGSYLAGLALSHARLGVVHGLAHPLGAIYGQPHGLVCAVCLPHALEFNRDAIGARYGVLRDMLGGDPVERVQSLLGRLGIVSPFAGRPRQRVEDIVDEALASGSTAANPRAVGRNDVLALLDRVFAHWP